MNFKGSLNIWILKRRLNIRNSNRSSNRIWIDEIRMKDGSDAIVRGAFLWSGISHMQGGMGDDNPGMSFILWGDS